GSYALVIGASEYRNGWDRLPGVKQDVSAVKETLESQGFEVRVVLDPTRENFDRAMKQFIDDYGYVEKNRLLIYFAGHGHTEKGSDDRVFGYIVPVDAPLPDRDRVGFKRSAVSMDAIEAYARLIETRHALFVFDSCFSGSLVSRSTVVPPEISDATAKAVRQFITSGAANQEVPDRSVFRDLFVRGINGAADLNGDRYVTGSELAMYLKSQVTEYSRGAQTPQYGKIRDTKLDLGDYVFMVTGALKPPPKMEVITEPVPVGTLRVTAFNKGMEVYVNGEKAGTAAYGGQKFTIKNVPARGTVEIRGRTGDLETVKRVAVGEGQETPVELMFDRIVNSLGMELKFVPGGTFMMGCTAEEADRAWGLFKQGYPDTPKEWFTNATPRREVTISQGNYVGMFEVTQEQWKRVMGTAPSYFQSPKYADCPDCPVEQVSWDEVQEFIKKLNELEGCNGCYRLPTEAEWEYYARAGTTGDYAGDLDRLAWYGNNAGNKVFDAQALWAQYKSAGYMTKILENGNRTHSIVETKQSKQPNGFGLYNLHGNVWEWCEDWYGSDSYQKGPSVDPRGPSGGSSRVMRGGGWSSSAVHCRSAYRDFHDPGFRLIILGFRLLRIADR
ncbi:MAG TPA: SUMF1/EgtB/PvdO family nonheme iron enzyme, partial [Acidobacteriota bacterium]|nr:SUMF1/EgtB/PvdO family nonheme iron enzyme [Acidobacteriota bacterium]